MLGTIYWIAGLVFVLIGAVMLSRDKTLPGVLWIAAGVVCGPLAMAAFLPGPS